MKERIILDTNCLVQSIPSRSRYHKIWSDFLDGKYLLCVSNEILDEYAEIIEKVASIYISKAIIKAITESPYLVWKEASFMFGLIQSDYDDNKFVDCAIVSNAKYIVSEDSHFNVLKSIPFPHADVVKLDDFLSYLNKI